MNIEKRNEDEYGKASYEKFGYECLGPLIYGFCRWLYQETEKQGVGKIFFLAREGKFFKEAFELLYPEEKETVYLMVSRHSILTALLCERKSLQERLCSLPLPHQFSLDKLYKTLELTEMPAGGAERHYSLKELLDDQTLLKELEKLDDIVVQNSLRQKHLIREYFAEMGFHGNVAIVDIGWKCRMQQGLELLLEEFEQEKPALYGYYLGLHKNNKLSEKSHACGYLFDEENNHTLEHQLMGCAGLLESICTAPHGSVRCYVAENGEIKPCLYDMEYGLGESSIISRIQTSAIQFIRDIADNGIPRHDNISPGKASENLLKFGFNPRLWQVRMFEKFQFFDIELKTMTGRPLNAFLHGGLRAVKNDFMNCGWRVGYMKRLFKLPLPYGEMYVKLRKKYEHM